MTGRQIAEIPQQPSYLHISACFLYRGEGGRYFRFRDTSLALSSLTGGGGRESYEYIQEGCRASSICSENDFTEHWVLEYVLRMTTEHGVLESDLRMTILNTRLWNLFRE